MRDVLIEFMDSLRGYVAENGTNIAYDERHSSEFVDIFLKQKALTITLDEAQNRLVKAMTTTDMKMTKEQIKLLTCPWWKFWNNWF